MSRETQGRSQPRAAAPASSCCPLPAHVPPLPLETGADDEAGRLAARAKALADPVRLRMLGLIAAAETCCRPAAGPGGDADAPPAPAGVCVCELQTLQGLAQSRASYHLKVLREAGLLREEKRGKWSFYTIDDEAARDLLAALAARLGV